MPSFNINIASTIKEPASSQKLQNKSLLVSCNIKLADKKKSFDSFKIHSGHS
jgi:hypothetical protein